MVLFPYRFVKIGRVFCVFKTEVNNWEMGGTENILQSVTFALVLI